MLLCIMSGIWFHGSDWFMTQSNRRNSTNNVHQYYILVDILYLKSYMLVVLVGLYSTIDYVTWCTELGVTSYFVTKLRNIITL